MAESAAAVRPAEGAAGAAGAAGAEKAWPAEGCGGCPSCSAPVISTVPTTRVQVRSLTDGMHGGGEALSSCLDVIAVVPFACREVGVPASRPPGRRGPGGREAGEGGQVRFALER